MNKLLFICLIIFFVSIISAEGLKVLSFQEDALDLRGTLYPVRDANNENCAVIRIEHNLASEVHITDVDIYERSKKTDNIIYFYLSKWEKSITISTKNYMPYKFSLPLNLKPEKTYLLRLFSSGEGDDLQDIPVQISTSPSGAEVFINEIKLSRETPVSDFFIAGTYPIRIELDDHVTLQSEITISGNRVNKNYILEPDFGTLMIKSNPEVNFQVMLNGNIAGVTPLEINRCISGKYTISTNHEYYESEDIEFEMIRGTEKEIILKAIPDFGNLEITSEPEINLQVYHDNRLLGITPFNIKKTKIGEYILEARHDDYNISSEEFELGRGETREIVFKPAANFGSLEIISEPEVNMTIFLDDVEIGSTPLRLEKLTIGDHEIIAYHKYYLADSQKIRLESGENKNLALKAKKNYGQLAISSDPEVKFNIYLNNEMVGITPLKLDKLVPGKYIISAKHEFYKSSDQEIELEANDYEEIVLKAEQNYGTLSVDTKPEATIYINDKIVSEIEDMKLVPQTLNIRVELAKHKTLIKKAIIKKYDDIILTLMPEPLTGTLLINPMPINAKVKLFGDSGEYYESIGISKFEDIPIGKYRIEVEHPEFIKTIEDVDIAENDRKKFEIRMLDAELGFYLNLPQELENDLEVKLYEISENSLGKEINVTKQDSLFLVGLSGDYRLMITRDDQELYSKDFEISSENIPQLKLKYFKYISPAENSKLYINGQFKDKGKELIVISENDSEKIRIKLPKALDYKTELIFDNVYNEYKLPLHRSQIHYGLLLPYLSSDDGIFIGIKPPIFFSPIHYGSFNGIELNFLTAGNSHIERYDGVIPSRIETGNFNGLAASTLWTYADIFNGLGFSFISTGAKKQFNGIILSGISGGANDVNGIALSGITVGARSFKGIAFTSCYLSANKFRGVSFAIYNDIRDYKGISLGLVSVFNSFSGISLGFVKVSYGDKGISAALLNYSEEYHKGIQIGLINGTDHLSGIQIGLINSGGFKVEGLQIGLLNFISDGRGGAMPFFPIINMHF